MAINHVWDSDRILGVAWWGLLSVIASVNIATMQRVWRAAATTAVDRSDRLYCLWMRRLAVCYVAGCALRSFLPRVDVERICFVDTFLSSTFVGRSAATVAELAFFAQLSGTTWRLANDLWMVRRRHDGARRSRLSAKQVPMTWVHATAGLTMGLILVAEAASWMGVTTTVQIWHGLEESLWALSIACLFPCWVHLYHAFSSLGVWKAASLASHLEEGRAATAALKFVAGMMVAAPAFVLFMVTTDIPMYLQRWRNNSGHTALGVAEGVVDAMSCAVVDQRYSTWVEEMPWMTAYFSICVWWSIWLARAPRVDATARCFDPRKEQ